MSGLTCKIFVAMCKMLATRFKMSTTGCKELTTTFRVVDDNFAHVNRSFIPLVPPLHSDDSDLFTGSQLRECPFRLVSPPDPSASHNRCTPLHAKFITAARGATRWFFQRQYIHSIQIYWLLVTWHLPSDYP